MERPLPPLPGDVESIDELEETTDENYSYLSTQQNICFKLDPIESGDDEKWTYLTPLRALVTSHTLPITARVGCTFPDEITEEGDLLVLHFIVKRKRVLAMYSDGTDVVLPIHASQLYDILPKEEIYDDRKMYSTRDVINCRPLPEKVKILRIDNSSGESTNVGKEGDIIELGYIDEVDVHGFDKKKILVGTCNGSPVAIHEDVKSVYTTMVHSEPQTLFQVVQKNSLPLRIRRTDDKVELSLKDIREEAHIIATHIDSSKMISIPIDGLTFLRHVEDENLLSHMIKSMYQLVNWTLCNLEHGRKSLPLSMQEIPQPLEEVTRRWSQSDDGRNFMRQILETSGRPENTEKQEDQREGDEIYADYAKSSLRKKSSIRDKFKQIRTRRRSVENSISEEISEPQLSANFQIQEMKSVLTAKEKENVQLKKENADLRKESQILQDEMSKLAVANKSYVEKLHRVYFENDDEKKRQHFESLDNDYVGITIQTPSDGPKRELPALPQETQPASTSCDHNSHLNSASVDDVAELLRNLKLDIYVDAFKEELVNGNLLLQLDFENLNEDLKMSRLHAKRLLMELNKRKETVT